MTTNGLSDHSQLLKGKKILVVGIANDQSIAYGCAKAFREAGADLAITYLNEKSKKYVQPIAEELGAEIFTEMNVMEDGQIQKVFDEITEKWGSLDTMLHSIAFCNKDDLWGRVIDCSKQGFMEAMDVSCHSFIRMAKRAEPLMAKNGTMFTMTYYGAEKVIENYNIMGPVKAALESVTRYLAYELGPKGISVNAISPGPLKTRAASGIHGFDELMKQVVDRAPEHSLVDIHDVGATTAFLASDYAKLITGQTIYIDGGYSVMG